MTRKKACLYDLINNGVEYFDFIRAKYNGVLGYSYKCDTVPDNAINVLKSFKNVKILKWRKVYAPEIKGTLIFIGDKCLNDMEV